MQSNRRKSSRIYRKSSRRAQQTAQNTTINNLDDKEDYKCQNPEQIFNL